jgi:hypothetical protein
MKHIIISDLDGTIADNSHRQDYISKFKLLKKMYPKIVERHFKEFPTYISKDESINFAFAKGKMNEIETQRFYTELTNQWKKFYLSCDGDEPIPETIFLLQYFTSLEIHILSGRSNIAREKTIAWLNFHGINFSRLLMREDGDYTPDEELKKQWLLEYNKEDILLVIDDRQKVVDMWKAEGLTVFQIHKPEINNNF